MSHEDVSAPVGGEVPGGVSFAGWKRELPPEGIGEPPPAKRMSPSPPRSQDAPASDESARVISHSNAGPGLLSATLRLDDHARDGTTTASPSRLPCKGAGRSGSSSPTETCANSYPHNSLNASPSLVGIGASPARGSPAESRVLSVSPQPTAPAVEHRTCHSSAPDMTLLTRAHTSPASRAELPTTTGLSRALTLTTMVTGTPQLRAVRQGTPLGETGLRASSSGPAAATSGLSSTLSATETLSAGACRRDILRPLPQQFANLMTSSLPEGSAASMRLLEGDGCGALSRDMETDCGSLDSNAAVASGPVAAFGSQAVETETGSAEDDSPSGCPRTMRRAIKFGGGWRAESTCDGGGASIAPRGSGGGLNAAPACCSCGGRVGYGAQGDPGERSPRDQHTCSCGKLPSQCPSPASSRSLSGEGWGNLAKRLIAGGAVLPIDPLHPPPAPKLTWELSGRSLDGREGSPIDLRPRCHGGLSSDSGGGLPVGITRGYQGEPQPQEKEDARGCHGPAFRPRASEGDAGAEGEACGGGETMGEMAATSSPQALAATRYQSPRGSGSSVDGMGMGSPVAPPPESGTGPQEDGLGHFGAETCGERTPRRPGLIIKEDDGGEGEDDRLYESCLDHAAPGASGDATGDHVEGQLGSPAGDMHPDPMGHTLAHVASGAGIGGADSEGAARAARGVNAGTGEVAFGQDKEHSRVQEVPEGASGSEHPSAPMSATADADAVAYANAGSLGGSAGSIASVEGLLNIMPHMAGVEDQDIQDCMRALQSDSPMVSQVARRRVGGLGRSQESLPMHASFLRLEMRSSPL